MEITDYYKSKTEATETFILGQVVNVQLSRFDPKTYKAKITKIDDDGYYSVKLARRPKLFSCADISRVPGDLIYLIKS